jgi:hypothetical protein
MLTGLLELGREGVRVGVGGLEHAPRYRVVQRRPQQVLGAEVAAPRIGGPPRGPLQELGHGFAEKPGDVYLFGSPRRRASRTHAGGLLVKEPSEELVYGGLHNH